MAKRDDIVLNEAQRIAVEHKKGPMMVLAGPGSGKTFVLIEHISYMTEVNGILPENILVITFTREAAGEMKERALKKGIKNGICFGTFHSVFLNMLKTEHGAKGYVLAERRECIEIIYTLLCKNKYQGLENATTDMADYIFDIIGQMKNGRGMSYIAEKDGRAKHQSSDKNYINEQYHKIYDSYNQEMRRRNRIDYDDMLILCMKMLKNDKAILEKYRNRYKYILIDEFQDINPMQFEIIKLLAFPENNLFIVGDDDQSIYGFRGSCPEIMLGFKEEYRDAENVTLDINYRSTEEIVKTSLKLIENNKNRYFKDLSAAKQGGRAVRIEGFKNEAELFDVLCNELGYVGRAEGFSKLAVLYRINKNSIQLVKCLKKHGLPYKEHAAGADAVSVMTFHASKGLEFENVYIIFASEGITPWKAAKTEAEINEERRMFYVAMTRAKLKLHIFYTKNIYNTKSKRSRFIDEIMK